MSASYVEDELTNKALLRPDHGIGSVSFLLLASRRYSDTWCNRHMRQSQGWGTEV